MKLEDLKGFTHCFAFQTIAGGNYGVFKKSKFLAAVHLDADEVILIINRKKKLIIYKHPKTILGEKILGISLEAFTIGVLKEFEKWEKTQGHASAAGY